MSESEKKRKKARPDWDDGRTVAPMNGDELPPYRRFGYSNRQNRREHNSDPDRIVVTKKERRAMIRAMFAALLPRLLIIILSFSLVFCLMYLWLS